MQDDHTRTQRRLKGETRHLLTRLATDSAHATWTVLWNTLEYTIRTQVHPSFRPRTGHNTAVIDARRTAAPHSTLTCPHVATHVISSIHALNTASAHMAICAQSRETPQTWHAPPWKRCGRKWWENRRAQTWQSGAMECDCEQVAESV